MSTDDSLQIAAHNGVEVSLTDPTHTFVMRVLGKPTLVGDILRIEADPSQTGRVLVILDSNGNESFAVNHDGTITLAHSGITLSAGNIATDTVTGMQIGTATSQKVGFWGATPIVQRSGSAQASVVTTGATNSSPYGFTQAQANAIITLLNEIQATMVASGLFKGSA